MNTNDTIAITGAAGFIGSYLTGYLNHLGFYNLILVDDFSVEQKLPNLAGKQYLQQIHRDDFIHWCNDNKGTLQCIFHLGARTDTTEMDYSIHKKLNLDYSIAIWNVCTAQHIPLLYASSAATYGNGEWGYKDSHDIVGQLQPLNPYGVSKNEFDIWALQQSTTPPFWAGVKFFNVYGPNEYHKARMASVIMHAYRQIQTTGKVKLFRSHNPAYKDGEQIRDFVYVKDVATMCTWLMQHKPANGLYNIGTGKARTFKDLVTAIFNTLHLTADIAYIDTPADIRDKYQYYTEADMEKLLKAGYNTPTYSLEEGIADYVTNYLVNTSYF
ncbi:ADP-glyceromanno-heptose 6-epimerase [Chitinophagaceae bacterium IBVUCB1]|nr:ADP-glyceromanno-heptose 6-epimerase [Chitinophagaceae bacterium IBVUCB1]